MSAQVTRIPARLHGVWAISVALLALVVVAVGCGLPLPWAIPALTLAPTFVIGMIELGVAKRPERFALR